MRRLYIAVFVLVLALNLRAQDESTLVKIGGQVPAFTFDAGNGVSKSIADLKGKVVFINFFADWCPPCRAELPHVQKEVYNIYKDNKDFVLLIFGREHDWATVNKFKTENNYTMPFYPDVGRKVFSKFAKQNIPRNFVIGRDGKIIYSAIGFSEAEFGKLKKVLASQLN